MGHLDLQAGQTSVPVELTVVPVSFAIAATHWPLVGLTALQQQEKNTSKWKLEGRKPSAYVWKWSHLIYLDAQTAWFPFLTDSTLSASTTEDVGTHFTLALQFLKERTHKTYFFQILHTWWRCSPATQPCKCTVIAVILGASLLSLNCIFIVSYL